MIAPSIISSNSLGEIGLRILPLYVLASANYRLPMCHLYIDIAVLNDCGTASGMTGIAARSDSDIS